MPKAGKYALRMMSLRQMKSLLMLPRFAGSGAPPLVRFEDESGTDYHQLYSEK